MLKQDENRVELLHELSEDESRLILAYRSGDAEKIICALKACGSLPAHWPGRPDKH